MSCASTVCTDRVAQVVVGQRLAHQRRRQRLAPHVEAPSILRLLINRLLARPIEIDLEPRTLADEVRRHERREFAGKRIFFAQPRRLVERDRARQRACRSD